MLASPATATDRTPDAARLEQAFDSFARASAALEGSYRALEQRVARLTEELAEANDEQARQAEQNARLCARLTELIEALPAGVVVVDADGIVEQSNATAGSMLGPATQGAAWRSLAAAAFVLEDAGEAVLRDGRRVSVSQRELPGGAGRVILLADDSEARAMRELLDRHRRLSTLGEMAARLAHQVRTPLAAALLYASQLDAPQLPEHERRRFAARTVARLRDIDRTVQEMLVFARGGAPAADPVEVGELLDAALGSAEPELRPGVELRVTCVERRAAVAGSRTALAGALANLVVNAAQSLPVSGRIEVVAAAHADGWLEIAVDDDGPGFEPAVLERAFEPFHTTRPGGTGLGLAIVRSVVEAHGGSVHATASALGGARVVMRLPAKPHGPGGNA